MTPSGRRALGRGLGALIPAPRYPNLGDEFFSCPVGDLDVDVDQPRQRFDDERLDELVRSIKEKGVLQPLVVRRHGDRYIVVAGERRLRAARLAGLQDVPVLVKDVASDEAFELALIENIQREDLNAIEEAAAYQRLLDRPGATQDVVARRVGKNRSTVANAVRLLRLDTDLQQQVIDGALSSGHARALLSVDEPERRRALAARVASDGLSVRALESEVRAHREGPRKRRGAPKRRDSPLQPYFDRVAEELTAALGTPVSIDHRTRLGRLVIPFQSVDDLRRLRDALLAHEDAPA